MLLNGWNLIDFKCTDQVFHYSKQFWNKLHTSRQSSLPAVLSSDTFLPGVCPFAPGTKAKRLHTNTKSRIKRGACLSGCPQQVNCKHYFTKRKNSHVFQAFDQLLYIGRVRQQTKALEMQLLAVRHLQWFTQLPFLGSRHQLYDNNSHCCRKSRNQVVVTVRDLSGGVLDVFWSRKRSIHKGMLHAAMRSHCHDSEVEPALKKHPAQPRHHLDLPLKSNAAFSESNIHGVLVHSYTYSEYLGPLTQQQYLPLTSATLGSYFPHSSIALMPTKGCTLPVITMNF